MNSDPTEKSPSTAAAPGRRPGESVAPAPPTDLDYELVRLIGRGGYGHVWLARDQARNYFACKVVYRESFGSERPYEREYEGIRKFEPVSQASESQVKILRVGRRDAAGLFFYVMELADDAGASQPIEPERYVPKTIKSEVERRGRLPVAECIQIGLSLSAALENLHQHGLIHRDIKPSNIIFVKGVAKLADIGLVTEADVTVSYVGTDGFIPPEGPTSPQADIFGLGKVLYEMSTGKDRLDYPELPEAFVDFPDREQLLELNSIVARACEPDARRRYASAGELQADLALLAAGKSVRRIHSAKRTTRSIACATLALALLLSVTFGIIHLFGLRSHERNPPAKAVLKIPVPDAARVAQCETNISETYRVRLAGATASSKQAAAIELLNHSAAVDDPAMEMASLRVASLLAIEARDFLLAMQICGKMGERFEMDMVPIKVELLVQAAIYARTPASRASLAEICTAEGFQALANDDYGTAAKLADLARTAGHNSTDLRLSRQAEFLLAETARCEKEYERVKPFVKALRENPGDPQASEAVGKFLCFVKNDWQAGLLLMSHGNDPALKPVLSAELNAASPQPPDAIALGNLWWDLGDSSPAEDRPYYQRRARYWYLKGLAGSKDPDKGRLRQQLADRIKAVPAEAGEVHIFSKVSGTETIDIYSDEVRWKSNRGTERNRINQVTLDDLKAGSLRIVKNSGATRLLPETMDFSTARLNIDHKPKRQGLASMEIADDHVRVTLVNRRGSSAELEVTVTFGGQP